MKPLGFFLCACLLAACAAPRKSETGDAPLSRAQASAKVHTELAAVYYQRGQLGIALEELRHALQMEPEYAPAYNVRGLVHMALREDKEAEEDFLHSLRLDGENSEAHNNYGWFLCQRSRERESIKQFLAALKNPLYQTPEQAYLNAGVCSQKAGEAKEAEEFLQKALVLQPEMAQARLSLAQLYFAGGDYRAANANFVRYAQSVPESLTAADLWMGVRIARKLGDRRAEESYALQLQKRFPDSSEAQSLQR